MFDKASSHDAGTIKNQDIVVALQLNYITVLTCLSPLIVLILVSLCVLVQVRISSGVFTRLLRFSKRSHPSHTKLADIAGMDETKQEMMGLVRALTSSEKLTRLGARFPRGAVLVGPPGTGKSLLARATASEFGIPFQTIRGSELFHEAQVRELFTTARKNSPCIIFIKGIDAMSNGGVNILIRILTDISDSEQILVLASTNKPEVPYTAFRPGRLFRNIHFYLPTVEERRDIFKLYLNKIVTKEDADLSAEFLAKLTAGFSGADIGNVVNEAAILATETDASSVEIKHLEDAWEKIALGYPKRKDSAISPDCQKVIAYHEAGHAICAWYFTTISPVVRVAVHSRELGYTKYLDKIYIQDTDDVDIMNLDTLMEHIAVILGGRVSEELHLGTATIGAAHDLQLATDMAEKIVKEWGLSKLGPMTFKSVTGSASFTQEIHDEMRRIVDTAYTKSQNLLKEKICETKLIAGELLRKMVLTEEDMVKLIGPRSKDDKVSS